MIITLSGGAFSIYNQQTSRKTLNVIPNPLKSRLEATNSRAIQVSDFIQFEEQVLIRESFILSCLRFESLVVRCLDCIRDREATAVHHMQIANLSQSIKPSSIRRPK